MSLFRSVATIGFYTLLSRVMGFIRDMLTALYAGAGPLTDAFIIAYRLPNFFRRIFAEGAFSAAFVPLFSGKLAADGQEEALRFARETLSALLLVLLGMTAIALLGMPWLVSAMAPGFRKTPEVFELTVELSRYCFPYLLFIALVAMFTGMLNSLGRFAAGAASPILLNLTFIGVLLGLTPFTTTVVHAMAYGVLAAGVVQLVWMLIWAKQAGCLVWPGRPRWTEDVRRLLRRMGPVVFGASVVQVNILIDNILASSMPGAVSFLYYADRINELPVGIIGIAIGTALLPVLSRHYRQKQFTEALELQNRALELGLLFSLPAMMGLVCLAFPVIHTLFEHGAFTATDTAQTVDALICFSLGLPAYIALKSLSAGFFANEDTKTPVKIGVFCVAVNLALSLSLIGSLKHVGLALATAVSAVVNAGLMAVLLYRRGMFRPDRRLKMNLMKMLLATLAMGGALWAAQPYYLPHFTDATTLLWRGLLLAGLVGGGGVVYFAIAIGSGAVRLGDIKRLLRRQPKA